METVVTSQDAMFAYGKSLITHGSKFLLYGDLGSGKTTLTKGIAEGLGIGRDDIQSPTYTYIHIYEEKVLHIDMRRLEYKEQLTSLGILDLLDHYPYVVIERPKWPELYADPIRHTVTIKQQAEKRICTLDHFQLDISK